MRNSSQGKDENIREMQERYEDIIKRKDNEISDLEQQLEISKTKVILLFKPRLTQTLDQKRLIRSLNRTK